MLPVVIIFCVLILVFIQRQIYRSFWYKNVKVDIEFEQRRVIEREPIRLSVSVENRKKLPLLSLFVNFALSPLFKEIDTNDIVVLDSHRRNELFSLFANQSATRRLAFSCDQRGVYYLEKYELNSYSLFMDEEYAIEYPVNKQIMVYPAAVNPMRFKREFNNIYGMIMSNDFHYEDVFTVRGVREYQPFDSQKRINWNATAKLGQLMVNNYEYTTNRKVVIFLNLAFDQLSQERIISEESIRIVKTWCMYLDKAGIQCNVYTNGADFETGKNVVIEKENLNKKYMEVVNESLTRIKVRDVQGDLSEEYRQLVDLYSKDHYIIFVSAYEHDSFQEELLRLKQKSNNFSWIIPIYTNSDFRPKDALRNHVVAWDVYWRKERVDGIVSGN